MKIIAVIEVMCIIIGILLMFFIFFINYGPGCCVCGVSGSCCVCPPHPDSELCFHNPNHEDCIIQEGKNK